MQPTISIWLAQDQSWLNWTVLSLGQPPIRFLELYTILFGTRNKLVNWYFSIQESFPVNGYSNRCQYNCISIEAWKGQWVFHCLQIIVDMIIFASSAFKTFSSFTLSMSLLNYHFCYWSQEINLLERLAEL